MKLATILVTSACTLLCVVGLYWLHRPARSATTPTPVSVLKAQVPAPAPVAKPHSGHNQKWENLPFRPSMEDRVPAARTPGGTPLAIADFVGQYSYTLGMSGAELRFRADGTCTTASGDCVATGSSEGLFRIVNGRVEIECLSVAGKPNGSKCVCIPVWWKGRVYILGPSGAWVPGGVAEFCNAINWGEEPRGRDDRGNPDLLFMREPDAKDTTTTSVPDDVRAWILPRPLEGKLVDPGNGPARVNLGRKSGVFAGQRLYAQPETGYGTWLRVLTVDEDSCTVGNYFEWSNPTPGPGTSVRCEAKGAGVLPPR